MCSQTILEKWQTDDPNKRMGCGSSTVDGVVVIHSTDPLQEPSIELVKGQSKTGY